MNKDRVKGKLKDAAGRIERQVGEWSGDTKAQAKGAMKQVEGKVQNAWGKAKDAMKPHEETRPPRITDRDSSSEHRMREDEEEESGALRRPNG